MFKLITYVFIGIIAVIVIGVIVIRKRQRKRMVDARMRGIKMALTEQKQYETLRKLEGRDEDSSRDVSEYDIQKGRRDIKR